MLTEQEVLAVLNQKIRNGGLSQNTTKYIEKMKVLQELIKGRQTAVEELKRKLNDEELEMHRLRGAISILLELTAEEEGLVKQQQIPVK